MSSRFVKSLDEIIEACPNSRWRNEEKLFPAIADEELIVLQPILGETLMEWLEKKGDQMRGEYGSLVDVETSNVDARNMCVLQLLSQLRKAVIYRMLSNNSEILSTSLNEGGGHNRMETDQYSPMTMDDLDKLSKKYYRNSIARIETILLLLEKDARSKEPVFKEMWLECDEYFYLHGDLLFPHLMSMKRYYKEIGNERIKYAQLCPDIRYCQDTYLEPVIGYDMVQLLCKMGINPKAEQEEGVDTDINDIRNKTLVKARETLGLYVQSRTASREDKEALMSSADMSRAQLCRFISSHQDAYGDAIKTSPLYTPPPPVDDDGNPMHEHGRHHHHHHEMPRYEHFTRLGKPVKRY